MIRIPNGVTIDKKLVSKRNEELKIFVRTWNKQFPIDLWWRRRNEITFNSEQHRSICLIDVLIEIEELLSINTEIRQQRNKEAGFVLNTERLSEKQLDDFDNIDLKKM